MNFQLKLGVILGSTLIVGCANNNEGVVEVEKEKDIEIPHIIDSSGYTQWIDTLFFKFYIKDIDDEQSVIKFENRQGQILAQDTLISGATFSCSVVDLEDDGLPEVKMSFGTNWMWSIYYSVGETKAERLSINHDIHDLEWLGSYYYYDTFSEECFGDNVNSFLSEKRNDSLFTIAKLYYINCDGTRETWLVDSDSVNITKGSYVEGEEGNFWRNYLAKRN